MTVTADALAPGRERAAAGTLLAPDPHPAPIITIPAKAASQQDRDGTITTDHRIADTIWSRAAIRSCIR
jgi:hypothetical protein